MHDFKVGEFSHLNGEINSLYHELALKVGVSDSIFNILYIIYEKGEKCLQSDIYKLTGSSRQTINSSIKKLEKDNIIYIKKGAGRNTIICLTDKGKKLSKEKFNKIFQIENKIWSEWSSNEQIIYLELTKKYRDSLKKYMNEIFED